MSSVYGPEALAGTRPAPDGGAHSPGSEAVPPAPDDATVPQGSDGAAHPFPSGAVASPPVSDGATLRRSDGAAFSSRSGSRSWAPDWTVRLLGPEHAAAVNACLDAAMPEASCRPGDPGVLAWWGAVPVTGGPHEGSGQSPLGGVLAATHRRPGTPVNLASMAVLPGLRRRGIARALIDAAVRHCLPLPSAAALPMVDLGAYWENTAAIGLYASMGFVAGHRFASLAVEQT